MMSGSLTSTVVMDGYPDMATKTLGTIRLLGFGPVTSVTVNGVTTSFTQKPNGEVNLTGLTLAANSEFTIVFS